jgi:glutamate racemase
MLKQMIPEDISLIDTGAAVARQLQRLLAERNLLAEDLLVRRNSGPAPIRLHFANILPILWNTAGVVQSFNE